MPIGQGRPSAHPTFPALDQPPFRAGGGSNEIAEGAAGVGKLREGAGFYDAITVGGIVVKLAENNDLVGIPNRRQAVGNHNHGAAAGEFLHDGGDRRLVFAVEGRGDLVEQQNGGVFNKGARNGNPLAFAARQLQTALPHLGVPPVWQGRDHLVESGGAGSGLQLRIGGVGAGHAHILTNGCVK